MSKLRVLTLVSLLLLAIGSACTLPTGEEDISIEDVVAVGGTMQAASVASAVEATLQAMASEAIETPTPQTIGQVPTPDNAPVPTPTVVIESDATSAVTASTGVVTSTATVVIEVAAPTSTVTSGLVSLTPSPVVQVATPTSIVSASLATVIPTATVAITPIPLPTAPLPTATPHSVP